MTPERYRIQHVPTGRETWVNEEAIVRAKSLGDPAEWFALQPEDWPEGFDGG